nr:DUF6440 family protein [Clostridium bornimense]
MTKEDYSLGLGGGIYIIVDVKTRVNYLLTLGTGFNGITPLLDLDGNVVIS